MVSCGNPHNSLDDVMSQIVVREVLKCLTYLVSEQQVAKGLFSIERLLYGIPYLSILNFVNRLMCLNAALGLAFLVTLALPLFNVIALFYVRYIIFNLTV